MSGQAAFDKLEKPAALCRGETAENRKLEGDEETKLNGVEEGQDKMSDEEGDSNDGEEELAAPDWRMRAGPRNTEGKRRARSNTRTVQRLVYTLHEEKRPHPSPRHQTKKRGSVEKAYCRHG